MNQQNNGNYSQNEGLVNRIRKRTILFVVVTYFFSIFVVLFGVSPFTTQVSAWCDVDAGIFSSDETYTEKCKLENLGEIEKLQQDRVLTASQYDKKINDCINGNAGGLDRGTGEVVVTTNERKARCANAIVSCQKYAIDTKDCTPDNLKTMAGTECNSGRLTGDGNDDCQRLKEMNGSHIDDIPGSACVGEPDNLEGARALNDCKAAVTSACLSDILNDDGTVKGNRFEDAKRCAADEGKKAAKSSDSCEARGGIWSEGFKDPVGDIDNNGKTSDVAKGCYSNYSDLINQPACEASGGKWEKTGGNDHYSSYGCNPPEGKNNNNTDINDEDGKATPPGGLGVETANGRCGQARVNLLACGTDEGAAAFNNVLRIILQVLTVLIGIAAIGGLAFASITYARAEDNSSTTGDAKTLIRNIVIGILLYGFLVAIISWLLPGVSLL